MGVWKMSQRPDVDLAREIRALKREKPKNTRDQIAAKLHVSVRTISNYSNHKWLSKRGMAYLPDIGQESQQPRSAVEKEAWGLCQSGDHEWMKIALYEVHAFRVTEAIKEQPGHTGSTVGTVYRVKTCSFCGFSSEERTSGYIVV